MDKALEKKLTKIEQMLRPVPDRYWSQADIAAVLQVSEATVRRLLKADPNAPAPLAASTDEDGQSMHPRFDPVRVRAWLDEMDRLGQSSKSASA